MNHRLACSSAILCSFLVTGCSTHTLKQTAKVSSSAITYTSRMNEVLEDTKQKVIDMDSQHLSMSRSSDTRKKNEEMLQQKNKALNQWIAMADQLREQNKLLQQYFETLEDMINSPEANERRKQSLSTISLSISEINQASAERQGKSDKDRTLTGYQPGYVGSLSVSLISNRYAHKVKQALIRDRNIINQQIALQKHQLKMISSIYKRRIRFANESHYAENVLGPYVNVSKGMFSEGSWVHSRNEWLENKQALTKFDAVEAANKAFSEAWIDILKGEADAGAVNTILGEANSIVLDAKYLRDSHINPQPAYANIRVVTPQQ